MSDIVNKNSALFNSFLFIALIQAAFLLYAIFSHHTFTTDSFEYIQQGKNILRHGSFYCGNYEDVIKDQSLYSRRSPGYAVFLIITTLFFKINLLTLFIQSILSLLNIYVTFRILTLVSAARINKWVYLAMFVFFPSQFIYASTFMSEIPFQTSVLLSIYFLLLFEKSGNISRLYLSQLFVAAAYLFKPIAVFLWIPMILYSITIKSENRSAQHLALLSLAHVSLISLFMFFNYKNSGVAEYSGIGRKVLINYTIPSVLSKTHSAAYALAQVDSFEQTLSNESYIHQCAQTDLFISNILFTQPVDFISTQLSGIPLFFLETCRWDLALWREGYENLHLLPSLKKVFLEEGRNGIANSIKKWPVVFMIYYFLVVVATIFIFILFIKGLFSTGISLRTKFFLSLIICYFALLTGPSASARFRLPVFPAIVILAMAGLNRRSGIKTKHL